MSRSLRSIAASVVLGTTGVVIGATGSHPGLDWFPIAIGAALVGASVLMQRRTAVAQVLARGAAWAVVIPVLLVTVVSATHGGVVWGPYMIPPALAGLALVLGHSQRSHEALRTTFAPLAYRSWLLAAATSAVGLGLSILNLGIAFASGRMVSDGRAMMVLALSLLASGIGVARMRSWGVLMGGVSVLVAIGVAMKVPFIGVAMLGGIVPGMMMVSAILAARAGFGHTQTGSLAPSPAPRVRIATDEAPPDLQEEEVRALEPRPSALHMS